MSEPYTPTTEEMIDAYVQQALAESGEKDPLKRLVLAVGFEAEADRWRAAITEPTEAYREALVDLLVMTPMADLPESGRPITNARERPMTDPTLDDLRAVAEAATPGPWSVHRNPSRRDDTSVIAGRPGDPTYLAHYAMPQTATYIATFDPPAVLALLDRVAAAERERDEALAQVARVREARSAYVWACHRNPAHEPGSDAACFGCALHVIDAALDGRETT